MQKVLVINNRFDCPFQPHYGNCRLGKYFGIEFHCDSHESYSLKEFPIKIVFDDPNVCPYHGGGMCRKTNPGRFNCYNEFPEECRLENYKMREIKIEHDKPGAQPTTQWCTPTCAHRYYYKETLYCDDTMSECTGTTCPHPERFEETLDKFQKQTQENNGLCTNIE